MATRTLGDITTEVLFRCDQAGYAARTPPALVRGQVVRSYQRLRELLTAWGSSRYIVGPRVLDTSSGTLLGYGTVYSVTDTTPVNLHSISRVEAQWAGRWYELTPVSMGEQYKWATQALASPRLPQEWLLLGSDPTVTSGTPSPFNLLVCPTPEGAIPMRIYGLSDVDLVDADATLFNEPYISAEWIICDVAIKLCMRDNDAQAMMALFSQERARQEELMKREVSSETRQLVRRRDILTVGDMGVIRRWVR